MEITTVKRRGLKKGAKKTRISIYRLRPEKIKEMKFYNRKMLSELLEMDEKKLIRVLRSNELVKKDTAMCILLFTKIDVNRFDEYFYKDV